MKKTKKQKNKKIKLLKDPNFIPKNKNVRICIFIIFNTVKLLFNLRNKPKCLLLGSFIYFKIQEQYSILAI